MRAFLSRKSPFAAVYAGMCIVGVCLICIALPAFCRAQNSRAPDASHSDTVMKELVEAGQAIIGSPETCARFINNLIEAGVDEVLLFMQGATTPHQAILKSIRLFAEEVRPRLRRP